MPLSKLQVDILRLLATNRNPESYIAGAAPLNRDAPRCSGDIDIFHSREERFASAAETDSETLLDAGYGVRWTRRLPAIYTAEISGPSGTTHLEWIVDSEFRFFPVVRDDTFGYVLHPVDLATNKVMAAAGRRGCGGLGRGRKATGLHARRIDCRNAAQFPLPHRGVAGACQHCVPRLMKRKFSFRACQPTG